MSSAVPSPQLAPQICGLWDECHLWVQWNAVEGATYLLEWRWRAIGGEWQPWQPVRRNGGLRSAWLALPIWKAGHEAQARVAVADDAPPAWELAQEVTFSKCRCRFEVLAERRVYLPPGSEVGAIVDGAACSYVFSTGAQLEAGERVEIEGESLTLSGYQQLDHPGHFAMQPRLGMLIRNVAPSVADTVPTGRDFTRLASLPTTAVRMVWRKQDRF